MNLDQTGAAEAVTEGTPAPAETVTQETPATMEDTMSAVWEKHNPPRGDAGRFAAKDQQPEDAAPAEAAPEGEQELTDQTPEQAPGTEATPSTDAPNAWSAEEKALWAKVPPEAQAVIARREAEAHKAITQMGTQIKSMEPVSRVLEQHRDSFQRNGVTPDQGIQLLLAASNALDENPEAAIQELAQRYGVDLKSLSPGQQPERDPTIARLEAQVRDLTGRLSARERSEMESQQRTLAEFVEDFATRPEIAPYFADLESEIMAQVHGVRSSEPHLPPDKVLEKAFEKAKWANPTVRERILQDQRKADEEKRKAEQAKQVAEAKKHQAISPRSGKGASPVRGTMEETMREVADRLMPG